MRAGKLRDLIRLERLRVVGEETGGFKPDPAGPNPSSEYEFVGEVWADVEDVSARERFQVGQLDSGMGTRVTIRYHKMVDATCRFIFGGRTLYVIGPPVRDQRRRQMTLTCQERSV